MEDDRLRRGNGRVGEAPRGEGGEGREESGGRRVVGIGTIGCGGGETGRYFFATGW